MEKERAIQCVPVELLEGIRRLAARLWDEKNPASVQLTALLEEFDPEVKSLSHIIADYEAEYALREKSLRARFEQKEGQFRKEAEDLKARLAKSEAARAEALKRLEELRAALSGKDAELAELKLKTAEAEGELNSRYVARMQELYEKVSRKEMDLLASWEEKNRDLERRIQEFESSKTARERQLRVREKELEEEFNVRKAELIRTFDKIREGLEAREKALNSGSAGGGKV